MLRITSLNGLGKYTVEVDDVNIDYPDTLDFYLLGTSIGAKKAQESRNFRATKEWRE